MEVAGIADLEKLASKSLPSFAWDYYRTGTGAEVTLRDNVAAYQR